MKIDSSMDRRIIEKNVREGKLKQKDVDEFCSTLPDLSRNVKIYTDEEIKEANI